MQLMKHQDEALQFLNSKSQAGLFFEMGLGKTLVTLEHLARMSLTMQRPFPCLIVCPLSVVSVWEREVSKFNYPFRVQKLVGTFQERLEALNQPADIYVINYEGLRVLEAQLEKMNFQTLILDESHRIKERKSIQTEIVLKLSNLVKFRYILTGTPVTKSPEDMWAQIQFLQPWLLGNFFSFRNRYVDYRKMTIRTPGGMREIKKAYRFKNLPELSGKVEEICLRRTKKECLDLPPKIYKTIYCDLNADQKKHYYALKNSLATMLESQTMNVSTASSLMQKLQQVCQGFIYNEAKEPQFLKDNTKLSMLKDLLKDLGQEKVILFCWFRADLELLFKELSKDFKVFQYGGSAEERGNIETEFQTIGEPCIFLAQIETAKEGITLTSANHVIYYGNSWNYATRKQSEDRAHRTGQTRPVVYYDFLIAGTVDEYVHKILSVKGEMADKVTGDTLRMAKLITGMEEFK